MRFALLTDLHFGRARADLIQPLLDALHGTNPDLVVAAGDFVQRARASQFAEARAFLDNQSAPVLAVPGNHDIPLFNLPRRLFAPRSTYRRWIAEETEPMLETPGAVFVGLDTTERLHHQRGKVTEAQIKRVSEIIARDGRARTVVVVAHHPFHQDERIEKKLMIGAPRALETWAEAGPHMIVSGHLHLWTVEPFVSRRARSMTLQVHCGTGLSTRLRGQPNDFAMVEIIGDQAIIERHSAKDDARFEIAGTWRYRRGADGWDKLDS